MRYKPTPSSLTIENISLNVADLPDFQGFGLEFEKEFNKEFKKIATEGKEFWKSEAARRLNKTRAAYQASITASPQSDGSVKLVLGGRGGHATPRQKWLAMAIEQGLPSYDLKPGFLKGRPSRVIPLDTKDAGRIFRTVKAIGHENKWIRKETKGLNLIEEVTKELNNNIIPKHVQIAFDKAMKKF